VPLEIAWRAKCGTRAVCCRTLIYVICYLIGRSIIYMKEDLKISQALSDISGECRAYGNLGAAYLHQGKWDDAVEAFKQQLLIAQKLKVLDLLKHTKI